MGNEGAKVAQVFIAQVFIAHAQDFGEEERVAQVFIAHAQTWQEESVARVFIRSRQEERVAQVFIVPAQTWIRQTWQEAQRRIQGVQGVSRQVAAYNQTQRISPLFILW